MKRVRIVQAVILLAVAAVMVSCSSGRRSAYAEPYPPRQTQFSLIINPSPGLVISRYPDGRYYYRNAQGYTYWRGYDNRYYLDRSYMRRGHYNQRQYQSWKQGSRKHYREHRRR